jgi:hypothetical protein
VEKVSIPTKSNPNVFILRLIETSFVCFVTNV